MEVDDGEVRGPGDLRQLRHAELVGVPAGGEGDARDLDPVRPLLGHPLLVDHLALDAVREAPKLVGRSRSARTIPSPTER